MLSRRRPVPDPRSHPTLRRPVLATRVLTRLARELPPARLSPSRGSELAHLDLAPGERGLQTVEGGGHGEPEIGTSQLCRARWGAKRSDEGGGGTVRDGLSARAGAAGSLVGGGSERAATDWARVDRAGDSKGRVRARVGNRGDVG